MKALAALPVLASVLILIAACGGEDTPPVTASAPAAVDASAASSTSLEAKSMFDRAMLFSGQGMTVQSIDLYSEAVGLDPAFADAYFHRAVDHYAMKRYDLARQDYNRVIELDPTQAQAFLHRGRCYQQLGQHEKAMADFNRALELEPVKAVYSLRARSWVMMGMETEADREVERGVAAGVSRHYMEWVIEAANETLGSDS